MFTGIVEKTVRVQAVIDGPGFRRLTLDSDWKDVTLGESIAVNGCCLTVAEMIPGGLAFDVIAETLDKTNLGLLAAGGRANVERSLRVGDRLSGHFVQGHVDGVARLEHIHRDGDDYRMTVAVPSELRKFLVPKGSVTLDGVSLTIATLHADRFEVALIPTTLSITALGDRKVGWMLNVEADVLSKTIVSYLELRNAF